MTIQALLRAFAMCASAYGARFQVPSSEVELRGFAGVWQDLLARVSDEEGIAAFREHIARDARPPAPADIVRLTTTADVLTAAEAWEEACAVAARRGFGDGHAPAMSLPAVRRAAEVAGWRAICFNVPGSLDDSFTQRRFCEAYAQFSEREVRAQVRTAIDSPTSRVLPRLKSLELEAGDDAAAW
jgi:hypothetical protein